MKRIAAFAAFAVMLLALYAWLIAQFVPSPLAVDIGIVAAIACAAGGVRFALTASANRDPAAKQGVMRSIWVRVPVFALLCGAVGFSALATGFPSLYTVSAGKPVTRAAVVAEYYYSGRHECRGFSIQGEPFLSPRLCFSHELARGTPVRLYGSESPLGLVVGGITVTSAR